jgi:hypothetical protein
MPFIADYRIRRQHIQGRSRLSNGVPSTVFLIYEINLTLINKKIDCIMFGKIK